MGTSQGGNLGGLREKGVGAFPGACLFPQSSDLPNSPLGQ